jgi:hypothetical protein
MRNEQEKQAGGIRRKMMKPKDKVFAILAMALLFVVGYAAQASFSTLKSGGEQAGESKLPPDVRSDTLSRMPRTKREDLTTDEARAAFDSVIAFQPKQLTERWLGPTGTRLLVPEYAVIYNKQDRMLLRNKELLDQKTVELTIAVATRETNNREEWINHHPFAVKEVGLEVMEIIRKNGPLKGVDEKEAVVIQYGRELFHEPKVSSKTFSKVQAFYGKKSALAIALLMAYYDSNALLMRAYDQHMDPTCHMEHAGCYDEKNPPVTW